jgi:DNA polymerase-4
MNAYFASIEQQVNPPLRGQPVGITPYTGPTGCVIARSYEAKDWGVGTGDLVRDARKKCPKIQIIEARPALYQLYHREILKVLKAHSPYVTPLSIDEFLIHLTGSDCSEVNSLKMAESLKNGITKSGDYLKCSIGIGPNYFLSKVAGESKKPDGLTVIKLNKLDEFYKHLRLRDLPGINHRMEAQLAHRGIYSSSDFFQANLVSMSRMFGHIGKTWYYRLRGYNIDEFEVKTKTIGHSHVLPPDFRTRNQAVAVIEKLVAKSGYRLRNQGYFAAGVAISVGFMEGGGFHKTKKCTAFSDNRTFLLEVKSLLKNCQIWRTPLYVAVSAFNLSRQTGRQISIFSEIERSRRISEAMDEVNDEFGASTLFTGSLFPAKDTAPDRIPFGRVRYEILNF